MSVVRGSLAALLFINFITVSQALERIITMRNLCKEPVWFGFAGGSVRSLGSQDTKCGGDGDCFQGTKCIKTGAISQCFFENPAPPGGNF